MNPKSEARKGEIPDWLFGDAIFVRPKSSKESCFSIVKKCNDYIKQEDQAGFHSTLGGIGTEPWTLEVPDGRKFRIIACMREPEFWRGWMVKFCAVEGREWALFRGDHLELSDGTKIPLSECYFHED